MAKELNLLGYLPPFLQEYRELKEIFSVEEPLLNQLNLSLEQVLQNQFINHCDEAGIAFFERMLNIYPYSTDDLKTRQERVLVKWNDYPPYTFRYLLNFLDNVYGSENYEFIENFTDYQFSINFINNFLPSDIESFYEFIGNVKPANLCFNITAKSNLTSTALSGVIIAGKYVKTKFIVDNYWSEIEPIENYSIPIITSNYLKEVFTFE